VPRFIRLDGVTIGKKFDIAEDAQRDTDTLAGFFVENLRRVKHLLCPSILPHGEVRRPEGPEPRTTHRGSAQPVLIPRSTIAAAVRGHEGHAWFEARRA